MEHWTVVWAGDGYDGPTGPWASEDDAEAAVGRWYQAGGWKKNPHRMRVVGPFVMAEIANKAEIYNYADFVVIKEGPVSLYRDHDQ
jgi:membrane-bound lytic murein transglycosylase B